MTLSRTGTWLAAGTSQGKITIWRLNEQSVPRRLDFARGVLNDLQFDFDERLLAIASRDLATYALDHSSAPELIRSDSKNYGTVRFSNNGESLLVITGRGVIEVIDARSRATLRTICCSTIYGEVAFTPDGQAIATAGHWPGVWDLNSGRLIGRFTPTREWCTFRPIAFDKVRETVLMGSQDGRVYVWDLATKQRVAISPPQSDYVDTLSVSGAGWVAYAKFGKMLRLWNPRTGEQHSFPAAQPTSNVLFDHDAKVVLFGTANGNIEFWNVSTGKLVRTARTPD